MKHRFIWLAAAVCLLAFFLNPSPAHAFDAVVGDGTPASCGETAFDAALAEVQANLGGLITFNCGPNSHTIDIYTAAAIYTQVEINGGGKIRLFAQGSAPLFVKPRFFEVASGGWLTLRNLTLEGGRSPAGSGWGSQGGSIVVWGSNTPDERTGLELFSTTILNSASSAWGGAIANEGGVVQIENSTISGSSAEWGGAYNGANGAETIINSTISDSTSQQGGGGVRFWNTQDSRIIDSTIRGNSTAGAGGGVENVGGALTIRTSYIEQNTAAQSGGGVKNSNNVDRVAAILIERSRVSSNHSDINGGGVDSNGTLIISDTLVTNNHTAGWGGGVLSWSGSLHVLASAITANMAAAGGGFYIHAGGATIDHTAIRDNEAVEGGGLFLTEMAGGDAGSWATITASEITGNQATKAGGAIVASRAYVTLHATETANNTSVRGVIHLWQTANGGSYMTTTESSIHDNSGGGFYIGAQATLSIGNTTVSQNGGWGVWAGQDSIYTQVKFSTVRGNTAGQLRRTGGRLALESAAIDAGGVAASNCETDAGLPAVEGAASWSSDGACGATVSVSSSFNLGALALNGGATPSHMPQAGSVLIDAAGDCSGTTHDQRGIARPNGAACDVGAVEYTTTGASHSLHLPLVVR